MSGALSLTVTTPLAVVVEVGDVVSIRAEDASGSFGVLPRHADFLTVMNAAVLRWRKAEGPWRYAAIRGGVLTVSGGDAVRVACREAVTGDDLARLEAEVKAAKSAAADAVRAARSREVRLHARAVREIMRRMRGGSADAHLVAGAFE